MTLQESLDKLKTKIEGSMPKEYVAIMHQATKDLQASGIGDHVLKKGEQAPSFTLQNQDGEVTSSSTLLKAGPLVITFYRGVWCPYCNADLGNLKRYTSKIEELGATMVSISPQLPSYNKQIMQQQRLNFNLLTDRGNEVAEQFGLR